MPSNEVLQRLRMAYRVAALLRQKDSAGVVQAWFQGMNPRLDENDQRDVAGSLGQLLVKHRRGTVGGTPSGPRGGCRSCAEAGSLNELQEGPWLRDRDLDFNRLPGLVWVSRVGAFKIGAPVSRRTASVVEIRIGGGDVFVRVVAVGRPGAKQFFGALNTSGSVGGGTPYRRLGVESRLVRRGVAHRRLQGFTRRAPVLPAGLHLRPLQVLSAPPPV